MRYLVIAFLLLTGCAALPQAGVQNQIETVITKLATAAVPDLQNAAADANAHGDVVAAQCWSGLIPVTATIQALVNPKVAPAMTAPTSCSTNCLFSNIQIIRDAKTEVSAIVALRNSGKLASIRQSINLACGALWVDMRAGIADPLGLVSGVAP